MELLSIGEMANLNNISVQTLRYYHKINLLNPAYINPNTNYRYYNIKQSAKLDMIQYMKSLGLSLKQIKKQFKNQDIKKIKNNLKKHSEKINKQIEQLQYMKKGVKSCIENYQRYLQIPQEGYISYEHIPERKIFSYNVNINIYNYGLETYEYILRKLKEQVMIKHLPMVYFCNVGSIIRKNMIDAGKFISTEIFVFLDQDFKNLQKTEKIPENNYLCIYFHSFWNEKKYAAKLYNCIIENNLKIVGDYICEVVVDLPFFNENERNIFVKLQIPIES